MAPVIKPASARPSTAYESSPPIDATKRKGGDDEDHNETMSDSDNDQDHDDLKLLRSTKKTGEGSVSKRTLQNRKAQREFRKRREARVRELEERCRRYDQMGLEANTELQRVAQTLKEENNALRGFLMRMGFGHAVPNILQDIGKQTSLNDNAQSNSEQSFQPTFAGAFGSGGGGLGDGAFGGPTFYMGNNNADATNAPINASRNRAGEVDRRRSQSTTDTTANTGNVTLASPLSGGTQGAHSTARSYNKKMSSPASSSRSTRSSGEISSRDAPLLSLDLGNVPVSSTGQDEQNIARATMQQQQQPGLDSMFGNVAGGGSAMLSNFSGFSVPHRNQQNSALLNPNPIPFSFNLSNNGDSGLQATWWDQVGGGLEPFELDDKAQAVANAQMGATQAQSPFDLSAFLQGGVTPGGGFQLGNFDGSQEQSTPANMYSNSQSASGNSKANGSGPDTEHMRMFVQLMERKMAERDARRYASLGFQPPSQDPAQRGKQEGGQEQGSVTMLGLSAPSTSADSQMSPSVMYSRLAQHPAFLSTNARELEELVDALGPTSTSSNWNGQNGKAQSQQQGEQPSSDPAGKSRSYSMARQNSAARIGARNADSSPQNNFSGSPQAANATGNLQVDERAIGKLFGLLDKKRGIQTIKGLPSNGGEDGQYGGLSMAMT